MSNSDSLSDDLERTEVKDKEMVRLESQVEEELVNSLKPKEDNDDTVTEATQATD